MAASSRCAPPCTTSGNRRAEPWATWPCRKARLVDDLEWRPTARSETRVRRTASLADILFVPEPFRVRGNVFFCWGFFVQHMLSDLITNSTKLANKPLPASPCILLSPNSTVKTGFVRANVSATMLDKTRFAPGSAFSIPLGGLGTSAKLSFSLIRTPAAEECGRMMKYSLCKLWIPLDISREPAKSLNKIGIKKINIHKLFAVNSSHRIECSLLIWRDDSVCSVVMKLLRFTLPGGLRRCRMRVQQATASTP